MKKVLIVLIVFLLTSCVDEFNRMENLKKRFPNCKIEPATGLIKQSGYDYIAVDSLGQMIAIDFYTFSDNKIWNFRNVR